MISNWRQILAWQELNDYDQIRDKFDTEVYSIVLEKAITATKEEVMDLINTAVGWPAQEEESAVASIIISYVYTGWNNLVTETATIVLEMLERRYE
jgi:hypothetical protein